MNEQARVSDCPEKNWIHIHIEMGERMRERKKLLILQFLSNFCFALMFLTCSWYFSLRQAVYVAASSTKKNNSLLLSLTLLSFLGLSFHAEVDRNHRQRLIWHYEKESIIHWMNEHRKQREKSYYDFLLRGDVRASIWWRPETTSLILQIHNWKKIFKKT